MEDIQTGVVQEASIFMQAALKAQNMDGVMEKKVWVNAHTH
jgi:hypothetical protein